MMRNKTSSSLQKTYDECYLICSTAVYYEAQGNEAEALRSWRSALDQIYYHNAYRMPSNYRPKTETEKALYDSLKNMELQCKERVDLLEALKQSRQENEGSDDTKKGESKGSKPSSFLKPSSSSKTAESSNAQRGYIGDGTIPAVSYPDISRPPALPTRPSYTSRNSSEYAVVGKQTPRTSIDLPSSSRPAVPSPPVHHGPTEKPSRSTSPDKTRTFRTTLRSGDRREKKSTPASSASSSRPRDAVGSKAATLAWTALGKTKDTSSTTSASDPRNLVTDHSRDVRFDIHTRRLVNGSPSPSSLVTSDETLAKGKSSSHTSLPIGTPPAEGSTASTPAIQIDDLTESTTSEKDTKTVKRKPVAKSVSPRPIAPVAYPSYLKEYPQSSAQRLKVEQAIASMDRRSSSSKDVDSESSASKLSRRPMANSSSPRARDRHRIRSDDSRSPRRAKKISDADASSQSADEDSSSALERPARPHRKPPKPKPKKKELVLAHSAPPSGEPDEGVDLSPEETEWKKKVAYLMKHLPRGVDEEAAKQIINEIVVQGDEVHWDDVAGLEIAKTALKETVVYPFLRPDLFMGLREPARGMLLFGPPGTGKTMLARAVATESKSTFFSISASSLTSKYLGESEKLVRALFAVAKVLAPSIIFVDEIDSLLSSRSGSGEHEATRRIKTEFLIQWSDLQRAAAGREQNDKDKERGDASRVLVLAATNLPWAIDEAARRRFVRRQYIPLPEDVTRAKQLSNLLGHQKHRLSQDDFSELVRLTEGFSGSDITALAKDAAMGPLRSLGDKLLTTNMSDIRPMQLSDFKASLLTIRPSVSKQGLKEFEDWAKEFGERGG